jgi:ubiquitin carboxyl-terminal hydrolase 25/28
VEGFWIPPRLPPPEGKTPLKSERAFIEDVRNEVQSLLEEAPPGSVEVVRLVCPPARGALEKALKTTLGGRKSVDKEEAAEFRVLGAELDADDETLKWAYQRQVRTDPGRKAAYLSALKSLGTRRDFDFQLFCVNQDQDQAQPDKKAIDDPIDKAYAHFNLERTYSGPESYIVTVYRTFREQSPAQKAAHRVDLLQIGKDRNSSEILSEVYGSPMEHSEACSFLGVDPNWPMESIAMSAQSTVQVRTIYPHPRHQHYLQVKKEERRQAMLTSSHRSWI